MDGANAGNRLTKWIVVSSHIMLKNSTIGAHQKNIFEKAASAKFLEHSFIGFIMLPPNT